MDWAFKGFLLLLRWVLLGPLVFFAWSEKTLATTNTNLVYTGKIIKPDGNPLQDSNVQFQIQVYGSSTLLGDGTTGADRCLLYEETQTRDMSTSQGTFSLAVGSGSSPTFGSGVSSLVTVFRNPQTNSPAASEAIGAISCTSGQTKFLSSSWDNNRELVVTVTTASDTLNLAAMPIQSVPYAQQALQVGGYSSDYLMRVQSSRPGASNNFSANQFDFLLNLGINAVTPGTPSTYQVTNLLANEPTTAHQVATKNYVDTAVASAAGISSVSANSPLSASTTAGAATVSLSTSGVTAGIYGSATEVPQLTVDAYGRVTAATTVALSGTSPVGATLSDGQIWVGNASNVAAAVSPSGDVTLSNAGAFKVTQLQGVAVSSTAPTSNQILQFDGTKWTPATFSSGTSISGGTTKVLPMFNATGDNIINSSVTDNGASGVNFANSKITFNGISFVWAPGTENVYVGTAAGSLNGDYNTALGNQALNANTANYNTAVGDLSLQSNRGNYNVGVGISTLSSNTTGLQNTALGSQALWDNTTGSYNTAVGSGAVNHLLGNNNTAVGGNVGVLLSGGDGNILIGYKAGPATGGSYSNKLFIHNNQSDTPLIGGDFSAGYVQINNQLELPLSSTTPSTNTGYGRVYAKADGNLYFKNASTEYQLNGSSGGTTIGGGTTKVLPMFNATGDNIINSSVTDNGASGVNFANSIISFGGTRFIHSTGSNSVFMGQSSGNTSLTGGSNTAIGDASLQAATSGDSNVAIGRLALSSTTTGSSNTALGTYALIGNTAGSDNTSVGYYSLQNATGGYNVAVGAFSMRNNSTGANNVTIGMQSALHITTGDGNVVVGTNAGPTVDGNYDNKLYIHNASSDTPLIGGDFSAGYAQINNQLELPLSSTTPSPNTGYGRVYAKADGNLYFKNSSTEYQLNSSSGGTLSVSAGGTGVTNYTLGQIPVYDGTKLTGMGCSTGQVLQWDVTSGFVCATPVSGWTTANITAVGVSAVNSATTSSTTVGVGSNALKVLTSGEYNTGVGYSALKAVTTGAGNTAVGYSAASRIVGGGSNTAVGNQALYGVTTGSFNIGIGVGAGARNSFTGSDFNDTTEGNNIFIGYATGLSAAGYTNSVAIGHNAVIGASNSIILGAISPAMKVGIGTSNPSATLHILATGDTSAAGTPPFLIEHDGTAATNYASITFRTDSGLNSGIWKNSSGASTYAGASSLNIGTNGSENFGIATNNNTRITVLSTGEVGIGRTPTYLLDVGSSSVAGVVARFVNSTGSCTISPTTSSLSCSSDERLKTDILDVSGTSSLGKILALQAKTYRWKNGSDHDRHLGYLAQDVLKIVPELVTEDQQTHYYQVNYAGFVPLITEGMKEQQSEIATLKEENKKLKKENQRMQADLQLIKQRLGLND